MRKKLDKLLERYWKPKNYIRHINEMESQVA